MHELARMAEARQAEARQHVQTLLAERSQLLENASKDDGWSSRPKVRDSCRHDFGPSAGLLAIPVLRAHLRSLFLGSPAILCGCTKNSISSIIIRLAETLRAQSSDSAAPGTKRQLSAQNALRIMQ